MSVMSGMVLHEVLVPSGAHYSRECWCLIVPTKASHKTI